MWDSKGCGVKDYKAKPLVRRSVHSRILQLANTVMVKKKTGKWCVYVDFTDLNKACPKDPFSMPRID